MTKEEKEKLIQLARRIEHIRVSAKLPQYLGSELTEIKYELRKLANCPVGRDGIH